MRELDSCDKMIMMKIKKITVTKTIILYRVTLLKVYYIYYSKKICTAKHSK